MKKLLVIWFILLSNIMNGQVRIDRELQPYVDSFIKECELRGVYIRFNISNACSIRLADILDTTHIGETYTQEGEILIDKDSFYKFTETNRKILIYHELTHWITQKEGHNYYLSIMSTGLFEPNDVIFESKWKLFLDQLIYGNVLMQDKYRKPIGQIK